MHKLVHDKYTRWQLHSCTHTAATVINIALISLVVTVQLYYLLPLSAVVFHKVNIGQIVVNFV